MFRDVIAETANPTTLQWPQQFIGWKWSFVVWLCFDDNDVCIKHLNVVTSKQSSMHINDQYSVTHIAKGLLMKCLNVSWHYVRFSVGLTFGLLPAIFKLYFGLNC